MMMALLRRQLPSVVYHAQMGYRHVIRLSTPCRQMTLSRYVTPVVADVYVPRAQMRDAHERVKRWHCC